MVRIWQDFEDYRYEKIRKKTKNEENLKRKAKTVALQQEPQKNSAQDNFLGPILPSFTQQNFIKRRKLQIKKRPEGKVSLPGVKSSWQTKFLYGVEVGCQCDQIAAALGQ